jgi:2-oxoglutarate ferredoxin oxidoreductase subunit beta
LDDNGHDVTDKTKALEKAMENGDRYPVGVFYKVERPDLAAGIALPEKGALKDNETDLKDVQKIIDDLML